MVSSGMEVSPEFIVCILHFYRVKKYVPYDLWFSFSAENSFCIPTKKKEPHILSLTYFLNTYFKSKLAI